MIFNTYADFQSQICRGMAERAEQLGYNLAIISSYGSYGTYQEYYQGEMMIFDLPSYDEFAGIVVAFDTFNIPAAKMCIRDSAKPATGTKPAAANAGSR